MMPIKIDHDMVLAIAIPCHDVALRSHESDHARSLSKLAYSKTKLHARSIAMSDRDDWYPRKNIEGYHAVILRCSNANPLLNVNGAIFKYKNVCTLSQHHLATKILMLAQTELSIA